MKLTCTKENLLYGLQVVSGIASKPSHLPILSHVYMKATDAGIELVSTNLEMACTIHVRAKVETTGSFTVPLKTVLDYVSFANQPHLTLELKGDELFISSGSSKTKIKGLPADEYPVIPQVAQEQSYIFDADALKQSLSRVVFACAKNDIRPELAGIYAGFFTHNKQGVVFAATDSYRLAQATLSVQKGNDEMAMIIPAKTVTEMIRLLGLKQDVGPGQVHLWSSQGQIAMEYGNYRLSSRLVDGNYPDYTQIIPTDFQTVATIPVDEWKSHMKAASLFTANGVNAVSLTCHPAESMVSISSTSTQTGQYDANMDTTVSGNENTILLNHRYVLDGLNQMKSSDVSFQMNGPDAPCLMVPKGKDGYMYIVMPIRQ